MPPVITIDDPDDPRIEAFRNVRDRDVVGRGEGFIAEGEVVIRQLLRSADFEAASLLVAAHRIETRHALLAEVPDAAPVYAAGQSVMNAIVGFDIHRGLLALGRRRQDRSADDLIQTRPRTVVGLVGIANHDNMGGIFRNCAAFGVDTVLLDETSCDPLYRKALRVSVGGILRVPFARAGSGPDLVERLRRHGYTPVGLSPAGSRTLSEIGAIPNAALILGAEGPGLPDDVLRAATTVRIDMSGGFDSLNVATTSGIALYELTRREA
ncbi:23S rRNA (guanosine-2'-O-)-methyltransferase RlmB [Hartmannibacter diazotrophicus]|uniref:23S rRNA (Guanosine-2'-O-)-methyltransferase RlmB n=1 Tax=Hartmannibacter diazotrophicus TaxID=1482074 RepID=A0A2C9D7P9_9HYPH|nr:RNA methyltransferase [Hartmannibacter diazotrophicus]SON56306.1 23S rRNA (guanosine-2'-O-)-methyltransferase RlmB [Hartmannibacter diazotrophicus]